MKFINKYSCILLMATNISYANVCNDLYEKNKVRWDKNQNLQLCYDAIKGDPDAQFDLAGWYKLEKNDANEALNWALKSAEQGCAKSQFVTGLLYYDINGPEPNWFKAFEWIEKSANNGLPHAQALLGFMYQHGQAVAQNKIKAKQLYEAAIEQQNEDGYNYLGKMYESGDGIPIDKQKAQLLFAQEKIARVLTIINNNNYPCQQNEISH